MCVGQLLNSFVALKIYQSLKRKKHSTVLRYHLILDTCSTFTEILYTGLYKAHEGSLSSFFTDLFDYFLSDVC
jgi:hypothetical protein